MEKPESLSADWLDPRYHCRATPEGFAIYERPKVDGPMRSDKLLSIHQTEGEAGRRLAILNYIAEGHDRYVVNNGRAIHDILRDRVVYSGRDSIEAAAELNAYERERLSKWK